MYSIVFRFTTKGKNDLSLLWFKVYFKFWLKPMDFTLFLLNGLKPVSIDNFPGNIINRSLDILSH